MSNGFVHSVKVPRLYKITAKTVQNVEEEGASLKQLIYEKKHPNLAATYALALTTIQHASQLDELLRKTQLLFKEPRLDPWLARVLITELLWGKKSLPSTAKPIQTILSYENVLHDQSKHLDTTAVVDSSSIKVRKPRYVRVNTIVNSVEDAISSFTDDGWQLLPKSKDYTSYLASLSRLNESWFIRDFHVPELLAFPPGTQFHDHPSYKSGAIILQDKASCLPGYLLNATPGSTALDTCAAPGMKTTHLAAIMQNKGKIYAVEKNKRRYETLCKLVEDTGATCVKPVNADATSIDPKQCPDVEYILVDPSCSGSGISDRPTFDTASAKCAPGRLRSLQSFQVILLRHALLSFPTAKRVVYSTCSMHPEENEMVIDEILAEIGEAYELVPGQKLLCGNWKNYSSTNYACKDRCLYANLETDFSNGFFVAVFERNFDVPLPEYKRRKASNKPEHNEANFVKQDNSEEDGKPLGGKRGKKNKSRDEWTAEIETTTEVNDDVEKSKSEKKKRKKNKSNGTETIETSTLPVENEENVENEEDNVPKKKRKKNKSSCETENETKMPIVEVNEKIENEVENISKKKRKKNEANGTSENQQDETSENVEASDKKQRKKERNSAKVKKEDTDDVVETASAVNETAMEKINNKKKKKHAELEEFEKTNDANVTEQTSSVEREPKKKKKKKSITHTHEETSS